ncbi:unnamed protein product [Peniophora sp. CBMAI 1063]|nr:unnamed protein product [Peniophora sp. CBMAI 1063]
MVDIGVVKCKLIEGWVVGPIYGMNVILFVVVMNALLLRRNTTSARWLLGISALQMAISTGHVGALLARTIRAFVFMDGAARMAYLSDERAALHTTEQALYTFNDVIAGGILTWRCFVVWHQNWRICALLVASSVGTAVSGIGSIVRLTLLPTNQMDFFDSSLKAWFTAFWVLSVFTQSGATALVAWKIWSTISWRARAVGSREWHVLLIFIESGALYSIGTILVLAFYLQGSNIGTIIAGMLGQLSATAPYLIIVRSEVLRPASSSGNGNKAAAELYALRELPTAMRQNHFMERSSASLGASIAVSEPEGK